MINIKFNIKMPGSESIVQTGVKFMKNVAYVFTSLSNLMFFSTWRKLLILSWFFFVLFNGCTKLDDASYTPIVASEFSPTSDDAGALLGAAYGVWRPLYFTGGQSYFQIQEETADAIVRARKPYGFYDGGIHQILHFHTWTSEDNRFANTWTNAYQGITACNRLLFQIESGQIAFDDQIRSSIVAEIKVLRASYYYVLVDVFGNVPIVTKYDVPVGFLPEQNTRKEVYDFIIDEITSSIPALSDAGRGPETYARFNSKWAAYALLARMYLNAEVYTGTAKWRECMDACDKIINADKGYGLEAVQRNVFKEQNQSSKEIIWAIPFDEVFGTNFFINVLTIPAQSSSTFNLRATGWGGLVSLPQFINTFEPEDKRLTDGWMKGPQFTSSGEPLKCQSGALSGQPLDIVNELPGIDSSEEVHSYRILKYEIPIGSNPRQMSNDAPMIRYAEILMMKAECLMRLGEPGAGDLVTQVRMRNFPNNPELAVVTDAELLETSQYDYGVQDFRLGVTHETEPIQYGKFLDELGREFCAEAHRRSDMIRFNVYNERSRLSFQAVHDGSLDYTKIGPIPLVEINTNTNLKQNPGY